MNEFENVTAPPPPPPGTPSAEDRQWALFAHLSALLGGLLTSGWLASLGCVIGPLIIWQIKKDTLPFAADQAKEALNFNITVAIIMLVLTLIGLVTLGIGFIVTGPLMLLVGIAALVFIIIAAIKSNNGEAYRYPFAFRFIK
ncbi:MULTISPECIES: DUF4870 domain-containing protein [Pseudoxanthomonas]|uniref:DUF4870 domain-containing protein n=1 Tax=Pseudoxanthomonas winnipegensis TaxID=2480810 RepID=A0A4Q9TF80_9GAMM|nr:DUF4870 domain-containing protein [Pseudoxanthomonas winnipegensis]RZZ82763.1 DUF4870 domain-containing protein [Pseudoxanthomonas winnipegensis]TAA24946.1 DUF4870 domain-containing protein [Pseudoxanthomonas winnipegensis]TAA39380.1 DUF4870 domain-containing protein [Pseudoxanthomonas winnipegensis]TBV75022.1 DUF4870 domain-containing protein [Pseudoxanthomonas winnipegensis]TBV75234.1 DUF4870 domain-containing protein [Pseudoxanthomonas winnipegensis]